MPHHCIQHLEQAQNFSEAINGAFLVYNLMLAEQTSSNDLQTQYQDRLRKWVTIIWERRSEFQHWDRGQFWRIVGQGPDIIPHTSRDFINSWLDLVIDSSDHVLEASTSARARTLIYHREKAVKLQQARLDNPQARALWSGNAGTAQLNYRWPVVQRMIADIQEGLEDS
jgi:hypothetical protein